MIKDRDQARELIAEAGITCKNVTDKQLESLWRCLQQKMAEEKVGRIVDGYMKTREEIRRSAFCQIKTMLLLALESKDLRSEIEKIIDTF